jgi:cytochrome b
VSPDETGGDQGVAAAGAPRRIAVWDWPVRIVHWSFALLLPALWLSWSFGQMSLHRWLGYAMLGLIVFRIYWGLAGSSTALFRSFVKGPRAVAAYLRSLFSGKPAPIVGHNAVGGWSVVAMLSLLLAQVLLGLFAQDVDGLVSGPLARFVSYETADAAREIHAVVFNVLLAVVGLHICAVAFYLVVKRDNLVGPMLTGRKAVEPSVEAAVFAPVWRLAIGVALAAGVAGWAWLGFPLPASVG